MTPQEIYCAICEAEVVFDAPPCRDGHEQDCPELLCTGCGTAILIAPVVLRDWSRAIDSDTAPQRRRAA